MLAGRPRLRSCTLLGEGVRPEPAKQPGGPRGPGSQGVFPTRSGTCSTTQQSGPTCSRACRGATPGSYVESSSVAWAVGGRRGARLGGKVPGRRQSLSIARRWPRGLSRAQRGSPRRARWADFWYGRRVWVGWGRMCGGCWGPRALGPCRAHLGAGADAHNALGEGVRLPHRAAAQYAHALGRAAAPLEQPVLAARHEERRRAAQRRRARLLRLAPRHGERRLELAEDVRWCPPMAGRRGGGRRRCVAIGCVPAGSGE